MTRRPTSPWWQPAAIPLAGLALAAAIVAASLAVHAPALGAETWNGLTVGSEHRCAPYDRSDYPYPRSVEADIVASLGGHVYGPYTGRHFRSMRETDIEHIVAVSEAHDSGLCAAGPDTRPALRVRSAQSHPRGPGREPLRWGREVRP